MKTNARKKYNIMKKKSCDHNISGLACHSKNVRIEPINRGPGREFVRKVIIVDQNSPKKGVPMEKGGLKEVRRLMDMGFNYDNLEAMAAICRQEKSSALALTAFVLHHLFMDLAKEIGDGPVLVSELRKLEAKYRTMINLALEETVAGVPEDRRVDRLTNLIRLHWVERAH